MGEIKSSKVTAVTPNGTWDSKYGTMYKFEVSFENGDAGEYSSKSQDQQTFKVGQVAEYEYTSREYNGQTFYNVKPVKQNLPNKGGYAADPEKDKRISRLSTLNRATDLAVAGLIDPSQILHTANVFTEWVYTGAIPAKGDNKAQAAAFGEPELPR